MMTQTPPLSSHIYGRLLALYPEDLRRDFGADMAVVFEEDLETARREEGMRGAIRVWRCALGEFLRYALPHRASSPAVRVSAVWFALSFAVMTFEMAMAMRHAPVVATPWRALCAALLLPALTTPLMALAVFWGCRGSVLTSLNLSIPGSRERQPCSKYTN
jgi:hypothetical protein